MKPIQQAWSRETSTDPEGWTETNPSLGQCAVTALVVQDFLGGQLLRVVNEGTSHYYNDVYGQRIDVTRQQFSTWAPSIPEYRDRQYVLSYPDTSRRYALLRERMGLS